MQTKPETQNLTPAANIEEIILACRKMDHKAQLKIYKLYYKTVYNICYRLVHDPGKAECTMFEAFLNAFENIDTYRSGSNFSTWLCGYINRI